MKSININKLPWIPLKIKHLNIQFYKQSIPGLAFVFERAGAKSVMASLWNLQDTTNADIIIQFYTNLKQGMSKAEAIQKAKLSQVGRHPYYWSPFILIGDGE